MLAGNWREAEQLLFEVLGSEKSKGSRQQAFATQTALGIPPTSRSKALKTRIPESAQVWLTRPRPSMCPKQLLICIDSGRC